MESLVCVNGELDTGETSVDRIWQSMPKRGLQNKVHAFMKITEQKFQFL